jgi:hypothetical protein
MSADEHLTKLMLKVIRDMKMMPNDIMSNGKTVSRNAFEHVRSVLQHDLELNVIKTKRRQSMKTSKTSKPSAPMTSASPDEKEDADSV